MPTKNVVPQNDGEGGIGTSTKRWLSGSFHYISGSGEDVIGVVSSSYAESASYAVSASHEVIKEVSSSYADTASYIENAQSASYVLNAISSSYATTASFAENVTGHTGLWTGSSGTISRFSDVEISGSLLVSGSIIPNFRFTYDLGSAAKAWKEIFVQTSSINFVSESIVVAKLGATDDGFVSSSFTGSFSGDGSGLVNINPFPFTGSAIVTGSLEVTGSTNVNGTLNIEGAIISGSGGDFDINVGGNDSLNLTAGAVKQFQIGRRGIAIHPPDIGMPNPPEALIHVSASSGVTNEAKNLLRIDDGDSQTQFFVSASNGIKVGGAQLWSDGYLGNEEFIPLTPIDFCMTDVGNPSSTTFPLGRDYMFSMPSTALGRTVGKGFGNTVATPLEQQGPRYVFAQKIIPKGFTATGVRVNTVDIGLHINAWSGSISNSDDPEPLVSATPVSGSSNANLDFIINAVGDGETYVTVQSGANNLNGEIAGGKIFIQRT